MNLIYSLTALLVMCAVAGAATPNQDWEVIPVNGKSKPYKLNAIYLRDGKSTRRPLVVLSHGSPIDPKYASLINVEGMLEMGEEFFKLGFAVLVVERRGYGKSKEKYLETVGDCEHRDDIEIGRVAAEDILGAVTYAQEKLDIDREQIVLAGHSTGGYSSLFAGSIAHKGVRAVVSFAGGRGSKGDGTVCSKDALIKAYSVMGRTTRIPTLWLYSENDNIFNPALAQELLKAFTAEGGTAELNILPPFRDGGHGLFLSEDGNSIWVPAVKKFFEKVGIPLRTHQ